MAQKGHKSVCWIITEGMAGTENQCIGVAEALGLEPEVMRTHLNAPWKSLSPYLGFEQDFTFDPVLRPPWPDLLITSGRKAIAASRYIKKRSGGKTITVHIQDPRISSKYFDLVAVPAHDPMRGDNVLVTEASPNKITDDLLAQAKNQFHEFEQLKSPRVVVLMGGNSQAYTITTEIVESLIQDLKPLDASYMVTCSRRTDPDIKKILQQNFDTDQHYFWDEQGENPYLALLAWADFILVTADSASMISESCTTGKPVYMIDLPGGTRRIKKLHHNLQDAGKLKLFQGALEFFIYEPLNDAQRVADEICRRFGSLLQKAND